jgi:ribosomal protein S18 acetylase RimI-like enzyme
MNSTRNASRSDVGQIARLWHSGWHDAHAHIVPDQLISKRTIESFYQRVQMHLRCIRVADTGCIQGMCITKDSELFQLYVSPEARGTGLAKMLLDDAEKLLFSHGLSRVWLACAIGNDRAAKFYKKCGWELRKTIVDELEITGGTFSLEVWRFEKNLT